MARALRAWAIIQRGKTRSVTSSTDLKLRERTSNSVSEVRKKIVDPQKDVEKRSACSESVVNHKSHSPVRSFNYRDSDRL